MATKIKVILDRSGSMGVVRDVTIDRFNEYINGVNVDRGRKKVLVSLYQFDDEYQVDYEDVPVQDVAPLTKDTYRPRGSTALLDAIGKTMAEGDKELRTKDKGICVIITDGYENASQEWTNEKISDLIKKLEDDSAWTFVYLGANQDAFATAQQFGFRAAGQTMSYSNDVVGNTAAYASLRSATTRTVMAAPSAGMANARDFFEDEEREEAEETLAKKS